MPMPALPEVSCKYGAPMGRASHTREDALRWIVNDLDSIESGINVVSRLIETRDKGHFESLDKAREWLQGLYRKRLELVKERERIEAETTTKLYLQREPLDSGGYDRGGAYWGTPSDLWRYASPMGATMGYIRARNRDEAKRLILETMPAATFFR